jgi:hypothetical protein
MVVVDQGKRAIGRTIEVTVTSVLQTTAGKMIFCRWPEAHAPAEADARREGRTGDRRDARPGREYRGEHRRDTDRREVGEKHAALEPPGAEPAPDAGLAGPGPSGNGPAARD